MAGEAVSRCRRGASGKGKVCNLLALHAVISRGLRTREYRGISTYGDHVATMPTLGVSRPRDRTHAGRRTDGVVARARRSCLSWPRRSRRSCWPDGGQGAQCHKADKPCLCPIPPVGSIPAARFPDSGVYLYGRLDHGCSRFSCDGALPGEARPEGADRCVSCSHDGFHRRQQRHGRGSGRGVFVLWRRCARCG